MQKGTLMNLMKNRPFKSNFIIGASWFFGVTMLIAAIYFGSKYLEGNGTIFAPLIYAFAGLLSIVASNRISSKGE